MAPASAAGWKRRRYSAGPTPSARRKARRIVSGVPKPHAARDRRNRLRGVLQRAPRGLQAHALHVAGGRDPDLRAEGAGEVARAHVGALGQHLHREVPREVLHDDSAAPPAGLAPRLLRGERGAELRLVAGPAQEQHKVAGDRKRGLAVEVLLDQRQREVHAGGHAGRGPDVARRARRSAPDRPPPAGGGARARGRPPSAWSHGARRADRRRRAGTRRCRPRPRAARAAARVGDPVEQCRVGARLPADRRRPPRSACRSSRAPGRGPRAGTIRSPLEVASGAPSGLTMLTR